MYRFVRKYVIIVGMGEETKRKKGPARRYPDSVYVLAFELHREQGKSVMATAQAINAKELCDRLDSQQIRSLAFIGERIKAGQS